MCTYAIDTLLHHRDSDGLVRVELAAVPRKLVRMIATKLVEKGLHIPVRALPILATTWRTTSEGTSKGKRKEKRKKKRNKRNRTRST